MVPLHIREVGDRTFISTTHSLCVNREEKKSKKMRWGKGVRAGSFPLQLKVKEHSGGVKEKKGIKKSTPSLIFLDSWLYKLLV